MADVVSGKSEWIAKLGPYEVPVFRRTARLLTEFAQKAPNIKNNELAAVILTDPLMTLRILHDANSRSSKRLGSEITTVEHAILRLGMNAFFEKYGSLPTVEEALANQPKALQAAYEFWQHGYHASWQARDFAVQHLDTQAEEVEIATLLANVADLLLCLKAPKAAIKLRRLRRKLRPAMAEVEVLGDSLDSLQQGILAAWRMPEEHCEMLAASQKPKSRQLMLRSALAIERLAEQGWWHKELAVVFDDIAGILGRLPQQIASTVHINAVHAAHAADWMPASPVARWLAMLPGEWPAEPEEEDEEAPAKAAAPQATAKTEASTACPVPNKRIFEESLKAIENHLDGSLTLTQMSAQILRGLHGGLGLSRILFAMLTPDGKRVKSRFTLGVAADDPLRHFETVLATKDMFGQLMTRMQGVWLNSGNRNRMWPMVNPKLQQIIGEGDFYAMSLFSGTKPIGMIYADRGHGVCDLDPATYTDFKILCLQAARGLAKAKPG